MHHVTTFHDPTLVAISVLIAICASFTSLQLAERMVAYRENVRLAWLCAAAIALGGGIWAMHFVGMMAFHSSAGILYDVQLTLGSLLLAIIAAGISYRIVVSNPASFWRLGIGGVIAGFGVAGMHYTGMAAMITTSRILYNPLLVGLSILIAMAAATAALWLSFNLHALWHRAVASLIMAVAIAGMHYTGMAALTMTATDRAPLAIGSGLDQPMLAVVITSTSLLILVFGLGSSMFDRRMADQVAQKALIRQRSERRHRSLLRNSTDIILVLDGENCIRYDTPAAERILGYRSEVLTGQSFLGFVDPLHQGDLREQLANLRRGDKIQCEIPIADAGSNRKWLELTGIDLTADPDVNGIVLNLHDITDRRRIAAELTAAKEKAETADQSKSAFLKNISHELRTPLNAIIGFSDLLVQQPFGSLGDPQYVGFARDINAGGKKLLSVINTIIDFTKAESGDHRVESTLLDPITEIRLCLRLEEETIQGKTLSILIEPEMAPLALFADRRKLRQVLLAVLSNATKFAPDNGKIAITIEKEPDGGCTIGIQDNGIGMTEAEIAIALQPFAQVDNSLSRRHEGTGLGLPMSRALMELHGGHLTIQSGRGVGTLVHLFFPAERVRAPLPVTQPVALIVNQAASG
ncbi:MHYT domain-containing protein [Dongia soli]|uniref:histidine kinase n=1 Tax=Dongia soli TaxID=600628 RepID=A0ABU5EBK6_9PROT|nr:MHYT domain-containing protein [Dongia soli]MDY0883444.1 MHYT domain-containing protein [Dongia soli]